MSVPNSCFTLAFKHAENTPIRMDVYPPQSQVLPVNSKSPAVVYFHGGGLTVGDRQSWFPSWIHRRVTQAGMAFISAEYRLIPPATGHDILDDIKDLFAFFKGELNQRIQDASVANPQAGHPFQIDPDWLAVSGSSAGGLCAYLAAMHASPRPKAVLSLYGMGGDMLTPRYLVPKSTPFFRGRELLDPGEFAQYLYPACEALQPTAGSPIAYHGPEYRIPGYPANPRMLLARLYFQMGDLLDYYTGSHNPSLSSSLRMVLLQYGDGNKLREAIPETHWQLFPQLGISSTLPPMLLIHGAEDTSVLVGESRNLHSLLQDAGVRTELIILDGKEHSFDYDAKAEEEFGGPGGLFDRAVHFLSQALRRSVPATCETGELPLMQTSCAWPREIP
ncbi:alpha/beta-hydrolase [Trametes elegans]|nr:alpha/beta-hydrolase [Trametes elegans]